MKALDAAVKIIDDLSFPVDIDDREQLMNIVTSCIGTKYTSRFGPLMANLALDAVLCVAVHNPDGSREVDIKKYAKIEKIAGGSIEDCRVLKGGARSDEAPGGEAQGHAP